MIMKKLLVTLHVYYHDQIDYFIDKLCNINGIDWDLFITYSDFSEDTMAKLTKFKPTLKMMQVGNTGYDVWPFIQVIQNTDVKKYEYILKLHTKNLEVSHHKLNGLKLRGSNWRNILVDSILKSPERFKKCIDILRNEEETGMICSYELFVGLTQKRKEDMSLLTEEAERIGMQIQNGKFCAGTMFIIKTACLEKIIEAEFHPDMWKCKGSHSGGTLAHVYERIFSIAVEDAGYKVKKVASSRLNKSIVFTHKHVSPVLKSIVNIDRYGEDSRKALTLFGRRFILD